MSLYQEKPLARGQIRTLTLHCGQISDPISCMLEVVTLTDKTPPYKALSYCWGPPGDKKDITIDGLITPIGDSLWQALNHLRFPSTDRRLWVDAVCIDQSNIKEREFQVSQMSLIYATATEVLVWLGKEAVDGLGVPSVSTEFGDAPPFEPINPSKDWAGFESYMEKIMILFDNGYWTRIWIIQEIMFAAKITIHFGRSQVSWRELTTGWKNSESPRVDAATSIATLKNQSNDHTKPIKLSLATWLHHFKKSECKEPRDKVYAFLGLLSPASRRMIKVDYNMSIYDVFWEVRRAEQFAHPREDRSILDLNFVRALKLDYLLAPRLSVALTSKSLKLAYMHVYRRSGLTRQEEIDRALGFGVDSDLESMFEGSAIVSYGNGRS